MTDPWISKKIFSNLGIQLTPVTLQVGVTGLSPSASHDRLVRGRFHSYGLLQQPIEKLSPRAGFATVKAERKLIQIEVQVLQADRTLVGSDQPALQQRDHQMHPGQEFGCRLLAPLQHRHSVSVSFHLQTGVSFPPVRVDHTPWLAGFSDEGLQAGGGGIPDPTQSDAADGPPFFLAGYSNQSLCLRLPPANPFLQPTDVGLVHFHPTVEPITPRSHHGSPKFVQPCPGGEVAAQTQYALQPQGAGSILLRRHPPDGPEPHRQRFPRILEDRARRQRRLVLAASADQQVAVSRPSRSPAAALADKALWPTQLQQVVPTRLFGSKSGLQFGQTTRVFLHSPLPQHIGLLESTEYSDASIPSTVLLMRRSVNSFSRRSNSAARLRSVPSSTARRISWSGSGRMRRALRSNVLGPTPGRSRATSKSSNPAPVSNAPSRSERHPGIFHSPFPRSWRSRSSVSWGDTRNV